MATYLVITESPNKKPDKIKYFFSSDLKKLSRLKVESAVTIQRIESELIISEIPKRMGDKPIKIKAKLAVVSPKSFLMRK